jgi:tetratricopeptide (TPR) repeat protein
VALADESYDQAAALYMEAVSVARELGDPRVVAGGLTNLGRLAFHQEQFARAVSFYEESLPFWRELGDAQSLAVTLGNLGEAVHYQGDLVRAEALYQEALAVCENLGDKQGLAFVLSHLGKLNREGGEDRRAVARYAESITLCRQVGDLPRFAECLEGLAGTTAVCAEPIRAARLFGAAEAVREAVDAPLPPVHRTDYEADVATVRAALDEATFAAAWATGRNLSLDEALAEAVAVSASADEWLAVASGRDAKAGSPASDAADRIGFETSFRPTP